MGEVREVFDVNQHPRKYGEITDLERRITAIKKRFAEIYDREFIDDYGINSWGFKTPHGTRFVVNGMNGRRFSWNMMTVKMGTWFQ